MRSIGFTLFLLFPLYLLGQRSIAPIPRNIPQVKKATLEAFERLEQAPPTGAIQLTVSVSEEGNTEKIRIHTDVEDQQKSILRDQFSQLSFFPARKKGEAISGTISLAIILKSDSDPTEFTREPGSLTDLEDLPPPPPFTEADLEEVLDSVDQEDEGFLELLGGNYRFPPVILPSDLNDSSQLVLDSKPIFLNLKVLQLQYRAMYPNQRKQPILLNVKVEPDGYVSEYIIKREEDRHLKIEESWINRMQFVPGIKDGEPVAVWVTVPFFVP